MSDTDPPTTEAADNRITATAAIERVRALLVRQVERAAVAPDAYGAIVPTIAHALDTLYRDPALHRGATMVDIEKAFRAGADAFNDLPDGATISEGIGKALEEYLGR